ncbi:acireductone synthase [Woodsholea maritima]|uniref:acireductone synthase n=1 Tax=Woodsholea maritima TaxID=240237 RepID=UPI00036D48CB|nr:acireductone synthase [Woodsholea maritima]
MTHTGIQAILTDIEGTTSSIRFVHDVLFPYATAHIPAYVRAHHARLADIFADVRALSGREDLDVEGVIEVLLTWIGEDKKATPLKALQGQVWEEGYKTGAFQGHIYEDAALALKAWHDQGMKLYVYSSGSVPAQKLLYGYSLKGDLTPLFSGYFDTTTGPKLEGTSYTAIAEALALAPEAILFLSDHEGEIAAAKAAGMQTQWVWRDQAHANAVQSFAQIEVKS